MGLRETVARAVDAAFDAIGNLVETVTYKSVTASGYTPATGAVTRTTTNVTLPRTVFFEFTQKEIDNDPAVATDMKLMFPAADLNGIVPKSQDIFTDSLGRTWEVQRLLSVPTDVVYILHCRTSR